MHYQNVFALSSLLLSGVNCAPLPQTGKPALAADQAYTFHVSFDDAGKPILSNSVTPTHQKRGGPLSNAADDAYTFTVSFDDKGKLIMDPGVDTSIFKNPGIFKTPISTTPIEGQHLKRGDPKLSAADDAYTFTISFDDKGKLILDPAVDKNLFKNPISTIPISTTPIKGLHNKRQGPNLAADDAYTFHVSFDDAGKMVLDPEFDKSILKNSGILNKPITLEPLQGQH